MTAQSSNLRKFEINTNAITRPPLATFAVFAFNQERFVEEAVRAALEQTYQPLEIILSDDCSSDHTYEIMQRLADEYVGPHQIKLNRNPTNIGLACHVNAIVRQSSGGLIVAAAGDDVSHKERVETLVAAWLRENRPGSICSMACVIDWTGAVTAERYTGYDGQYPEQGEDAATSLMRYASDGSRNLLGCAAAWDRSLFETFGEISGDVINEDNVIGFRSWLSSRVSYVPEVLVQYRTHDSNLYHHSNMRVLTTYQEFTEAERRRSLRGVWESAYLAQHLRDLARARSLGMRSSEVLDAVEQQISSRLACKQVIAKWPTWGVTGRLSNVLALGHRANTGFKLAQLLRINVELYCGARYMLRTMARSYRAIRAALRTAPAQGSSHD